MHTMKKFLTAALLITAITSLAAASTADMTIFPKDSSTRINSFTSYEVNIENVGPVKDTYDLSSSNPREISIAPRQVDLQPGEEETINVWYNPETSKEEGTYSFSVTATSQASGQDYSVEGTVNVIKEHRVSIEPDQTSRTGCLGQEVVYNLEVTNEGIQKEEFQLTTDEGRLSNTELSLEDGETQNVQLAISADEPVQRNFNVVAASETSYAQDIQNLEFNTEVCYGSETGITPQQQEVPAFTEAEYTVNVRNTGTRDDTFTLSSNIGELEETELQIDGESSASTTLSVTPEELETRTVQVTAESTVTSSAAATLDVVNGMNMNLGVEEDTVRTCEDGTETLEATLENTGAAPETYRVSMDSVNFTDEVQLEPGESVDGEIQLSAEDFEVGTHSLELRAAAQTFGQPVKSQSVDFVVENCWDLKMNVVPEVESAGENRSTIYEIHLNNTGTRENTYNLSHEGPEWISVKPEQVTVEAGESETAYMYAGIPYQKEGEVKITAVSEGNQVRRTQEVTLLIGEEIQDAIKSDRGNGITGAFSRGVSNLVSSIGGASNLSKIALSVILGLLITAGVLLSEW